MFSPKPRILIIDGQKVPIDPDFRIMCEYSEAVSRNDESGLCGIASSFFFAGLPEGVTEKSAAKAMLDFYVAGLAPGGGGKASAMENPEPSFDFEEDEAYFFAAFLSEYGIDLNVVKLHWFDFCAMFRGLPDECRLKRIISIRSESLSDIKSPAEKARVRRLKGIFALKRKKQQRFKDVHERDNAMLAEIERIHREAREKRGENV